MAPAGTCVLLAILLAATAPVRTGAIDNAMTTVAIEQATDLARFPHSNADRAKFHASYVVDVQAPPFDYFTVKSIEVITAFRRLELIAEAHARTNDLFARGGLSDAEEALRPWRDRVSVIAHVEFDQLKVIPDVPALDIALEGSRELQPLSVRDDRIYSNFDDRHTLVGATIEAAFDARSVDQGPEGIAVSWNGRPCAHAVIDFSTIE